MQNVLEFTLTVQLCAGHANAIEALFSKRTNLDVYNALSKRSNFKHLTGRRLIPLLPPDMQSNDMAMYKYWVILGDDALRSRFKTFAQNLDFQQRQAVSERGVSIFQNAISLDALVKLVARKPSNAEMEKFQRQEYAPPPKATLVTGTHLAQNSAPDQHAPAVRKEEAPANNAADDALPSYETVLQAFTVVNEQQKQQQLVLEQQKAQITSLTEDKKRLIKEYVSKAADVNTLVGVVKGCDEQLEKLKEQLTKYQEYSQLQTSSLNSVQRDLEFAKAQLYQANALLGDAQKERNELQDKLLQHMDQNLPKAPKKAM